MVPRIVLHGEVGSLDEIALGLALTMVLVADALLILTVWRSDTGRRAKVLWSVAIFLTHMFAWAAYGVARALARPRVAPEPATDGFKQ